LADSHFFTMRCMKHDRPWLSEKDCIRSDKGL